MKRPAIRDLAGVAGVSVATVNRVLAETGGIRPATRDKVQTAAETIGFHGLGATQSRYAAMRLKYLFGVLLLQPHRQFCKLLAAALRPCGLCRRCGCRIADRSP